VEQELLLEQYSQQLLVLLALLLFVTAEQQLAVNL
jgi:hypothetical protein